MSSLPSTLLEQCGARAVHLEEQARELEREVARTQDAIMAHADKLCKKIRKSSQAMSENLLKQKEVLKQSLMVKECTTRKLFMAFLNLTAEQQQEEWEKLDKEEVNCSVFFAPAQFNGMGILGMGAESAEMEYTEVTLEMKKEQPEVMEVEVLGNRFEDLVQEVMDPRDMNQRTDVKMNPPERELERNVDEKVMEAAKLKKLVKSSNLEKWVERKKTSMVENTINALDETNDEEQARGNNFEANKSINKEMECNTDRQCPMCDKMSFSSACQIKEHISTVHFCQDIADIYIKKSGVCDECGKKFHIQNNLIRHIGSTHNKVVEIMEQKGFPITNILETVNKRKRKMKQLGETGHQPLKITRNQTSGSVISSEVLVTSGGSQTFLPSEFRAELQRKGEGSKETEERLQIQARKKTMVGWLKQERENIHQKVGAGDRAAMSRLLGSREAVRKTARRPFIAVIEVEALVQCSKCSYRAVDPRGLKVHVSRIHTGRGPLECPCCDFRADELDKLTRHIAKWHK